MLGCDHSSVLMAQGFVMLANAVLMFTSTSILHHPSFMKKKKKKVETVEEEKWLSRTGEP